MQEGFSGLCAIHAISFYIHGTCLGKSFVACDADAGPLPAAIIGGQLPASIGGSPLLASDTDIHR